MRTPIIFALLLIAGCRNERPPAPDANDNRQLDEAGAMLDALANEEGAAPEDTAPLEPDKSANRT